MMDNGRQLLRRDEGGQLWEVSILQGGRIVGRRFCVTSHHLDARSFDDQPAAERAMDAELQRIRAGR